MAGRSVAHVFDTCDPVVVLGEVVEQLLTARSAELPAQAALGRLSGLLPELERLRLVVLDGLLDVDRRQLYTLADRASAAGWLRSQPVCPDGVSVTTARRLAALPLVDGEVRAGRLSLRAASDIAGALDRIPPHVPDERVQAVLDDAIPLLVSEVRGARGCPPATLEGLRSAARSPLPPAVRLEAGFVTFSQAVAGLLPPAALARALADLVDALLPETLEERDDTTHAQRHLTITPLITGGWHLTGLLDDETGQLLTDILDRAVAQQDRLGPDTPDGQRPVRTTTQTRHDCLHDLLRQALNTAPRDTAANSMIIHVRLDTLTGQPGALPARLDQARIARSTAQRLLCNSVITRLITGPDSAPLDVGHPTRLATRAQRTAILGTTGGRCAAAGCGNPATVIHHVQPHADGGPTDLANLLGLCTASHHDIHTGRYTLTLKDGRTIGPHGWVQRQ